MSLFSLVVGGLLLATCASRVESVDPSRFLLRPSGSNAVQVFSPASLTPDLWVKADVGREQTSGGAAATADTDPIGRWLDQSGNGRHLAQTVAGSRPIVKLAIQNGLPVVRFDGTDDFLSNADYTLPTQHTIAIAYANRTLTNGSFCGTDSTIGPLQRNDGIFPDASTQYIPISSTLNVHKLLVLTSNHDTEEHIAYLDGANVGSLTGTAGAINGTTTIIGSRAGTAEFLNGDVCELVIIPSVLSTTNRDSLTTYLKDRWGLY